MISRKIRQLVVLFIFLYLVYLFSTTFSTRKYAFRKDGNLNELQLATELEQHSNWREYGLNFQPNKKANLPLDTTIRRQLSFQFPYDVNKPIQKNIWQTWKVGLDDPQFPSNYKRYQETWNTKNEGYKHYVISDDECHELISELYSTVPDVSRAYNIMPKSILKADFFRYLILFARGGVYSDVDTVNLKPIDTWVSLNNTLYDKPNNAGLVVGIEADPDRPDWNEWYARRIQFCQWTIQAKKGHPMLRELIAKITELTLTREKNGELKKILGKDAGGDIMNWTGPGIFTDYVFMYMNNIMQKPENFEKKEYEEIINWKLFTGMQNPIIVDDVLVLPITSFSPGVGQMGAKSPSDKMAYVQHVFLGSWKD